MGMQIFHTFQILLQHHDTWEELLYGTQALTSMLDWLSSPNRELRRMCETCLKLVMEGEMRYNLAQDRQAKDRKMSGGRGRKNKEGGGKMNDSEDDTDDDDDFSEPGS